MKSECDIYLRMKMTPTTYRLCTLLTGLLLIVSACSPQQKQEATVSTPAKTIQAFQHKTLERIFADHNYAWNGLDQGVPPLILRHFPDDLHLIRSTRDKKALFFATILPMAMLANEEVTEQRRVLQIIFDEFDHNGQITVQQQANLNSLLKRYKIKASPLQNLNVRMRLLSRVDTIPESLVLAQAANESGWGTSRFARQANNIFGQWTFTPGTGIVPAGRPKGETYEVRRFTTLYQSVRAYMRNINTHRAYATLRNVRAELRQAGLPVTGDQLASTLINYSTRREAYAREIRRMIKSNQLEPLTSAAYLRPDASIPTVEVAIPTTGLLSSKELLRKKRQQL